MVDLEFIAFQQALAGEYSLERELGRGGMGIVYLAREVQLDRLVAIKVLPSAFAARADIRGRFLREARMAASLSHPHIVPIYRVSEANEFVFFVMAYVDGETLGERLRARGPLSAAAGNRLLREVAWALSYAHGRGIVHRDIKPDNILIEAETGRALVSDFGIAQGAEETRISEPGHVMGTAHFMSPEQAASEPLDGRSDLYSLGVVAYLALSGQLPFDAPNAPALLVKHLSAEPPPLATVAATVPRPLVTVVERLLKKAPSDRFASGEALAEALESASTPTRAKLPIALRVWTQARDPLRVLYTAWGGVFSMGFLSQLRGGRWDDLWLIAAVGAAPVVPLTIFHARKAYQALSAGYTLRDLRAAVSSWQQERRDELAFEYDKPEPGWARGLRSAVYTFLATDVALFAIGMPHTFWSRILIGLLFIATAATVTVSSALGVPLLGRRIGTRLVGAMRSWFWNSRAGEWAAKLLTPANRTHMGNLDYRPTEMALGLAVEQLFAALPRTYREHLGDLPAVVERLEAHAAAARARLDELNALMPGDTAGSLTQARDSAKRELADSVAALEAVRLDLLRLHGGASDLRPITTVLEAARELGEELDRLSRAQREIDDLSPPLGLRPHTPV